ncbi:ABC transporter ATP-binding protein [Tessaracoccus sp. ZS01]|uniref:ABC transporter ATP-binding protein n=1 Tax=Tessaracoccus sp. ZS01 TaxID=1906324 RepID=UPI00096D3D1F|nr:ABC transporter ATP-binding protein [Tessaracoccus sp. ZS01]MCG6568205.1 ABC transporter ATP-binding protein [Tessaracoccus sp. ZS01]OMG53448.1 dipeptide/oligopeptide/nickel ABC transporter ATP-binding protein [Tessaracoccus sp. ZS01]
MTTTPATLLEVEDLDVVYLGLTDGENVKACADIGFTLKRGEILGIAGESASGKSTLLNAVTRLQQPPAVTPKGSVRFYDDKHPAGIDLVSAPEKILRTFRWSDISLVMQSAMACLNPVTRLQDQFADALHAHDRSLSRQQIKERTAELLGMVGIAPQAMGKFAHELSGGMRQRALIALALACDPDLIVMDEPTTAVDVVMQRQILNQILRLQHRLGFAVIFVTHDLSLLLEMADRIAIMYGGRIVEIGAARQIAEDPQHPYTQGLRNAFPSLTEPRRERHGIPGSPPDLRKLPSGCSFRPRCEEARGLCAVERPELVPTDRSVVACHVRAAEFSGGILPAAPALEEASA